MFEINQEVIIDGSDVGKITLADYSELEPFFIVKSEMTGTIYHIDDEKRLEATAYA